ncbi:MAG: S-layer homology domain-containing protein, partial [Eubacteriales bacterium]
ILQPKFGYMGVGAINSNPPYWVQLFADSAGFTEVTTSAGTMNFASEADMQKEYLICTDQNGVVSYLPMDTGVMEKEGNTYTLKLSGKTVELTVGQAQTVGTFTDVKPTDWFADAVSWAVEKNITAGTSATTFSPEATCTRAQILTFLWRAVGSPKANIANPFDDVKAADYYYDAALWAKEKGFVSGSRFEGDTPCTRAYTVIYLWKNAGSPNVKPSDAFADVDKNADYAQAVAWALENGVTSGTSATTFSPELTCTRGQIVTFLKRALN